MAYVYYVQDVYSVTSALLKYPSNGVSHCHKSMVFIMKKKNQIYALSILQIKK